MPETYFSSEQEMTDFTGDHSSVGGTVRSAAKSDDAPARIRPLHVLILGGLSALASLSTDMYLPSLPALSRDLGSTVSAAQVTLSAGILGLALGQLLLGPVSDAVGRRRPLLVGIGIFTLASVLCVFAPTVAVLTALRFVQGIAGAAGLVISLAIVNDLYRGTVQARFLSLLVGVSGLAPIVAPVIGSQMLVFTSWHGVFVTLAAIGIVLLAAVALKLDETLPAERRQNGGISASLSAFRKLLSNRRFVGYALSLGFSFANGIIFISVSPFILQNIYGLSPQIIGVLFGVNALGIVIMSQISGRLVGRIDPQKLLTYGLTMLAAGGIALLLAALTGLGLPAFLLAAFVVIASLGLISPNATTLALTDVQSAGSASALLGVLQLVIGAVAAPLVGLAGSASAVPMAVAIAAVSVAGLVIFMVLGRPVKGLSGI